MFNASATGLSASPALFAESQTHNSLEGVKRAPDGARQSANATGLTSDIDELLLTNPMNTTVSESRPAYYRIVGMGSSQEVRALQAQRQKAIKKLRYLRKQKKFLATDVV